ncbi:DUF1059 domain-containing protein [uncultured Pseudoteredinibacter sp.]|uniref:DUF1059 domain-containing protein n=1 Tax=uncultured Pseudoteredinibacter sp. TaxID=1641701 RepID=UPI002622AE08|nr:DUF1059 domain-containing protein [uncultured Pseudoteredinibacter sp.]
MKSMTCKQLGGACDMEFRANSFEEIAELSQQHGMTMHEQQDPAHIEAMREMGKLMQNPEAMGKWLNSKRLEFEAQADI